MDDSPIDQLSDDYLEELTRGIKIPAQPDILIKVEELIKNDASNEAIANAVMQDMALSAKILNIVNSAFFALPTKVTSLREAITLFGVNGISNLVRVTLLRKALGPTENLGSQFWDRCIATAMVAAHVALNFVCKISVDDAYTLGLFHRCGMPLLLQRFPDYGQVIQDAKSSGRVLSDIEAERYSCTQGMIGSMLAKSWGLSEQLWKGIRHQDEIGGGSLEYRDKNTIFVLQLACWLAEGYFITQPCAENEFLFYRDVETAASYHIAFCQHFDLKPEELDYLQEEVIHRLKDFFSQQNAC